MADLFAPSAALPEAPVLPLLLLPAAIVAARWRWTVARRARA